MISFGEGLKKFNKKKHPHCNKKNILNVQENTILYFLGKGLKVKIQANDVCYISVSQVRIWKEKNLSIFLLGFVTSLTPEKTRCKKSCIIFFTGQTTWMWSRQHLPKNISHKYFCNQLPLSGLANNLRMRNNILKRLLSISMWGGKYGSFRTTFQGCLNIKIVIKSSRRNCGIRTFCNSELGQNV